MAGKTDKLHVGVVGVGYLGRFHAEKFAAMEGVELAGVVDIDSTAARRTAAACRTDAFQDYRELFGRVDAVSIVTPTPGHFAVAKAFLEHGCDLMIEKPITSAIDQAEELIHTAAKYGRIIQVGHLERFNPAFVFARERIRQPRLIEARRNSTYKLRGTEVSVVLDLMIHDIDLVLSLVTSRISEIRTAGMTWVSEHHDVAAAHIEFESGCVANLTASRIANRSERKMHVFQGDSPVIIDFADHEVSWLENGAPDSDGATPEVTVKTRSLPKGDALMAELKAFVHSAVTRQAPVVSGEMGRDALKIALDIMALIEKVGG